MITWYKNLPANVRRGIVYVTIVAAFLALAFVSGRQQLQIGKQSDENRVLVERVAALTRTVNTKVDSLQRAIVESCQENGNSRARVAREQLHEEIKDAEHPDPELLDALNLSPEAIDRLTNETIAKLEDRLDRVKLTPCATQYQISPGSGDRRRDRR